MKQFSRFILLIVLALCLSVPALGEGAPALVSEYWTENSAAAESLNAYLLAVTDASSPDFIPVADRIAVFDLDGTLLCETCPFCFEYMVFADYALNSGSDTVTEEIKAVAQEIMDAADGVKPSGMSTRQAAAGAAAYQGMTVAELSEVVRAFRDSEAAGFSGLKRGSAYYLPMLELFNALLKNDFTVYIVTATERNIVRELIRGTLDIPPAQVIGTEYGYTASGQGDTADVDYTFQVSDRIVFDGSYYGENSKMSKVDAIVREIGQQPVLAFGNSGGDLAMAYYTIANNPYKSAAYMVLADDTEREYGNAESAAKAKAEYEAAGISVISMKDDFATIYGPGVEKTSLPQAVKTAAEETAPAVSAEEPAPEAADSSPATQYVLYLGTNDMDTNKPVFTQSEAMDRLRDILIRFFGGYTIQEAYGGWVGDDGKVYQEYTLVIYLSDTTEDMVHQAAQEMLKEFRQSSVLIQANPTKTEFYSGN